MSKRTRIIITCNGCFQSQFIDTIVICETVKFGARQLDLCVTCSDKGLFICEPCKLIHKHEADCKNFNREIKLAA